MAQEPHKEAYEKYAEKLVRCLPMDDTLFIAKLSNRELLPGDTHDQLKALPTQPAKALYFLNHVIKPALDIDDASSFDDLLSVMDQCGYTHVKKLACKIKSEIIKMSDSEPETEISSLIVGRPQRKRGKTDEKVNANDDSELLESHHSAEDHLQLPPQPKRIIETSAQNEEAALNYCVNKSSIDFWRNLKVTWQQCADLPWKFWVLSVAELDGKVYVSGNCENGGYQCPLIYDSSNDQWSSLPNLPCWFFSLVTVTEKKQLLAIGGVKDNNHGVKASNKVFLWDEKYNKWLNPYPNMPTARCSSSSISHGLTVIVTGGITSFDPFAITRSVEVLHINDNNLPDSYWSVVEQLPHVVYDAIPLIVNDKLYIAQGYDKYPAPTTCNVVTASLPELLQSSNSNTSSSQVWNKLPDMPYSSHSITHYQGRLITFTGDRKVERLGEDKPVWELVPLIHIYNPGTETWDCVGKNPSESLMGMSAHISENKILFIGSLTGVFDPTNNNDIKKNCSILTFTPLVTDHMHTGIARS